MHENFRRYFWTNISVILGSLLVFGAIFYFLSQSLGGKVAEILADRTAIAQRSTDLESLSKLKTDTAAAAEIQKKIDSLLPSQDNLIGFPQFVNNLARVHSLSSTFNFEGAPNPGTLKAPGYVSFSLIIEGEPRNIRSFIDELENRTTRFAVNLLSFSMTPRAEIYHAEMDGQVFFQENRTPST